MDLSPISVFREDHCATLLLWGLIYLKKGKKKLTLVKNCALQVGFWIVNFYNTRTMSATCLILDCSSRLLLHVGIAPCSQQVGFYMTQTVDFLRNEMGQCKWSNSHLYEMTQFLLPMLIHIALFLFIQFLAHFCCSTVIAPLPLLQFQSPHIHLL